MLGGQRYESTPPLVPVEVEISQPAGASLFDLRLRVHLSGACMRCLGFAEIERASSRVSSTIRTLPQRTSSTRTTSSTTGSHLSTWARDAIALELPDQILCRPDCAGLCPVCGKDLNVEPHEHLERDPDPRWAALEELRDTL